MMSFFVIGSTFKCCLFSYNLQIYPFSVTIYLYLIYIMAAYSAILNYLRM